MITVLQCESCRAVVNRKWGQCLICHRPLRPPLSIGDCVRWPRRDGERGIGSVIVIDQTHNTETWVLVESQPTPVWVKERKITYDNDGSDGEMNESSISIIKKGG